MKPPPVPLDVNFSDEASKIRAPTMRKWYPRITVTGICIRSFGILDQGEGGDARQSSIPT